MPFTIPDFGEGDANAQSVLFQEDLDILVAGISGIDCVLSGLAVTGGADMTPAVAKGAVLSNRTLFAVAAADVTITTADTTNPRIDLIVVNSSGALAVRAGTPAANPYPPIRSANDVVIAMVYVPANDTAIATTQIIDKRVSPVYPVLIDSETAGKNVTNSSAATSIFNAAPSIPNGLFLAGRILRVRAGGRILHNTTTGMTLTVAISYGGTTIFSDVTATFGTTASSGGSPWWLEFDLVAQANNNQRMSGFMLVAAPTAPAPTTGSGDLAVDEILVTAPISGPVAGIAVDSDAANRTLDIQFTLSVANANHQWDCHSITVELV